VGDFQRDTAVGRVEGTVFECHLGPDWWVVAGPNGGYLAAIIARALAATAGAGGRPLRSLTVHYLRAPAVGPASVEVDVERDGRSVGFAGARLVQDGRTAARALAVLADSREGLAFEHARAPDAPAPEDIEPPPARREAPPFARNFAFRPVEGAPFAGAREARSCGWLRLNEERELDAPLLAALCDSWFPAAFAVTPDPLAVPTLELTVHLRASLPRRADWVLGRFITRTARHGLLEEDAEIFSREGELLAQSRQLALAL
jgi:acyl-CoA thioesterase